MNDTKQTLREFQVMLEERPVSLVVMEAIVFAVMMLLAILGNAFTLFVIWKKRRLRTVTNYFIACLAVSDIIMGLFSEPLFLVSLISSKWLLNDSFCQYQGFIAVSMSCVSIQTLAWTGFSRYIKVVKSNNVSKQFTTRRVIICLSFIWGTCLLSPAPYLISGQRFVFHPAKFFCYLSLEKVWFTALLISVYVALPTIAIVICYYKVFIKIYKHTSGPGLTSNNSTINVEEIKVTRSLALIVFVFMACWTPVIIIDLVDTAYGTWILPREAYAAYTYLATLSTCVNPFIYGLTNPQIRKEYITVWRGISSVHQNVVTVRRKEQMELQDVTSSHKHNPVMN